MYTVCPSTLSGTVHAPASKSETHREFILSAPACGTSVIKNPLESADTKATLRGISALGAKVERNGSDVIITGGCLHAADEVIDCGNSGTTLRFLTVVAARLKGTTRFTGDDSLMKRPMQPLLDALSASCGAEFSFDEGVLSVTGSLREPCTAEIRGGYFIAVCFCSAYRGHSGEINHAACLITLCGYDRLRTRKEGGFALKKLQMNS